MQESGVEKDFQTQRNTLTRIRVARTVSGVWPARHALFGGECKAQYIAIAANQHAIADDDRRGPTRF